MHRLLHPYSLNDREDKIRVHLSELFRVDMWPKGQRAVKGDPEERGSLVEDERMIIKGNRRDPLCFMSVGSVERHFTLRHVQF